MKLILTQEVDGLGAPGDVVEVKDGYGRNYLVPRGLAMRWTRGGEKTVESIKKARASRAVRDQDHAEQIKSKLEAQPVPVQVRAGAGGRLFGAVTTAEIAGALAEVSGEAGRQAHHRGRPSPIKSLGAHQVSIKLHDEVSADVASTSSLPDASRHSTTGPTRFGGSGPSRCLLAVSASETDPGSAPLARFPT